MKRDFLHPLSSRRLWMGALVLFALQLGCGGSPGKDRDPAEAKCDAPLLASAAGLPLDEIAIEGIPGHFSEYLAAKVTAGEVSSLTLIARQENDSILLVAPIHPAGLAEGGEVTLEIVDADGRSCAPLPFTILPLPPAPGATDAMADKLRELLDGQAAFFQASVETLRLMDAAEVPPHLLPLYLAQHSLDDPENPNSLRALLDGSAPDLEGTPADLDLVDRLLAKVGFPAALEESLAEMETLLAADQAHGRMAMAGGASNAYQLDKDMAMAQWAKGYQGDGGLAQATRGVGSLVGLGGLVPVPHVKAGSMVLGTGLFAFLKGTEGAAKLLPSRFVSIEFELSPASFAEDDPRAGEWHDVLVVARSEGWELDKAILETLFQYTKVKGGYDGWINRFAPKDFLSTLGRHLHSRAVGEAIRASADGSGILTIPPEETQPIDITEDPWSFGEVHFALTEDGRRQGYRLDPDWEGDYEAEVKVGTGLGKFGGQHIYLVKKLSILPLQIEATPRQASLEPGESIEFTIRVPRAFDTSISASADKGNVAPPLPQPDETYIVHYTAPASEDDFPDSITVRSESNSGMLANPDRRRPSLTIPIRGKNPYIEILPRDICLDSGEKETFTAEVFNLENQAVRWEVSAGKITQQGRFTAPSIWGPVEVTATSVEDEAVQGVASIRIGNCSCHWTASLSGAVSQRLTGDSTIISLRQDGSVSDLQFNGPEIDGDGTSDVLQVMLPQGTFPNSIGSFPTILHGLYAASEHSFSSQDVVLHLDRFEAVDRVIDGETVETYHIEGSLSGQVEFGMISGEIVPNDEPPPSAALHVTVQGHYDYPILWMINCSGGYGDP